MSRREYALPTQTTGWTVPGTTVAAFSWDYDTARDRLLNLYDKGKTKQWNSDDRLDWSLDFDPSSPEFIPDHHLPISGAALWEGLSQQRRDEVRHHYGAWLMSQFLHGEQGALICAARTVETVPDLDAKWYGATQVMDEARHVEVYVRYLRDKIQLSYPINPHTQSLLNQTLSDSRWDMTYLGMQIMIEGVALAAFAMLRDFTNEPLTKTLNAYVMQDEARHVAFGLLALKDAYAEASSQELAEREEFVIEASYMLRDRFLAEEVWTQLGLDVEECVTFVEKHDMMQWFRKALFSRVVPNVKRIGLWSPRIQRAFEDMGVLEFQELDPDDAFTRDDRVAEEFDRLMAEGRHLDPTGTFASDAEQVIETIAVGLQEEG